MFLSDNKMKHNVEVGFFVLLTHSKECNIKEEAEKKLMFLIIRKRVGESKRTPLFFLS